MSGHGPSLRFVATQQHVGYGGKADSDAASTRQICGLTAQLIEYRRLAMPACFSFYKRPENEEAANGGGLEAMGQFRVSYGRPSTLSIWSWKEPVPYSGLPLLVPNEVANVR